MKTFNESYSTTVQVQDLDSTSCGLFCLYVADQLLLNFDILDILTEFHLNKNDFIKNENILKSYFRDNMNSLNGISGGSLFDTIKPYIFGRDNYPPNVRNILAKYGDWNVYSMNICRAPIVSTLRKVINWMSFGALESNMKKLNYDEVYHLFMYVDLHHPSGKGTSVKLLIEKNHVINIKEANNIQNTYFGIDYSGVGIYEFKSLNSYLNNAIARDGQMFFRYDSVMANCQKFIMSIVETNNLITDKSFIMQDAQKLLPSYMQKFNRFITNTAAAADVWIYGQGLS
jgi:hypothetical protein